MAMGDDHQDSTPVPPPSVVTDQSAVSVPLGSLNAGLEGLIRAVEAGGLGGLDGLGLTDFLRQFESFRNRLSLVDHRVIADAERAGSPGDLTHQSMAGVLVQTLRLSRGEATRNR